MAEAEKVSLKCQNEKACLKNLGWPTLRSLGKPIYLIYPETSKVGQLSYPGFALLSTPQC